MNIRVKNNIEEMNKGNGKKREYINRFKILEKEKCV
jgi:hypothetical protein